ncbi:MAG TPA: hypothetical protein PKC90_13560 [Phycisphaerales bacterium]|nr:hypothetical protein [Phycisphaerales bacterium]
MSIRFHPLDHPAARRLAGAVALPALLCGAALGAPLGSSSTWLEKPEDADFLNAANWTPMVVPTDTASFGASSITTVDIKGTPMSPIELILVGFSFLRGAPDYTFELRHAALRFSDGIAGSSGASHLFDLQNGSELRFVGDARADHSQHALTSSSSLLFEDQADAESAFITLFSLTDAGAVIVHFDGDSSAGSSSISIAGAARARFTGNATAGSAKITAGSGAGTSLFGLQFADDASAGASNILLAADGKLLFEGFSTAAGASILNDGPAAFAFVENSTAGASNIQSKSILVFQDRSSAGSAFITSGGAVTFEGEASAEHATIICQPTDSPEIVAGLALFGGATLAQASVTLEAGTLLSAVALDGPGGGAPSGDFATVVMSAGSTVDISGMGPEAIGIGSLSGDGDVFLGEATLVLAGLGTSDTFAGRIRDGSSTDPDQPTTGNLSKVGFGTLRLLGDSTFSGSTQIQGGRLTLNGSLESDVIVGSVTALGGTGTLRGSLNLGAMTSVLGPGDPIGRLTLDNDGLIWPGGSVFDVDLGRATADPQDPAGGWDSFLCTGAITIAASPANRIAIVLRTLDPETGAPAELTDFDPAQPYSWLVAIGEQGLFAFAPDSFEINTSGFLNRFDGTFSVEAADDPSPSLFVIYLPPAPPIIGDLNGDGIVDGADLGLLLDEWGTDGPGDLNGDGVVDGADLGILMAAWTTPRGG